MAQIESRRQLVEQLNTRLTDLTGTAAQLDERTEGLAARMSTTDQQFQALTAHAAEAARIEKLVPTVVGTVERVERRMTQIDTAVTTLEGRAQDRKSTRLNSSHTVISYAVFCLKKKKKNKINMKKKK